MKVVQIVPRGNWRLYGAMMKREADLRKRKRGTFYRVGARRRNEAKWKHRQYKGWVNLERGLSEVVSVEVKTLAADQEWQMLAAFLGWIDRHFADEVLAVNIQYR
jgi:hypothetical protein